MTVILNDKQHEVAEGTTLASFVEALGIKPNGVAVAIDYEVVPKERWEATVLYDGVEMMLITAVSGG